MQTQELQIKIGKKVKELRSINGLTQEQAAAQMYMCRNTYSDIELGKSDISLSRLVQLANFYHVGVDYFVDDKEKVVFYLSGNIKTQANKIDKIEKQCNEYHGDFTEGKFQNELEKQQLINELKDKEITMKDREIENLKTQILQLQEINSLLKNM